MDPTFKIFQFFYLHLTLILALESEVPMRFVALQVNLFPLSSLVKPEIFNSAIFSFGIFSPPKNHSYSSISGFPEPKHCATNVSSWVKESVVRWTAISGLPKFKSYLSTNFYHFQIESLLFNLKFYKRIGARSEN